MDRATMKQAIRFWFAAVVAAAFWTGAAQAKPLVEMLKDTGSFKQLVRAIELAGLKDALGAEGPFTIFAPTDEAFAKLPKAALNDLLQPNNRDKLMKLLRHHILGGLVVSREFSGRRLEAIPLSGDALLLDARTQPKIAGGKIVRSDILADNGVIHVIDTVLIPSFDDMSEQ